MQFIDGRSNSALSLEKYGYLLEGARASFPERKDITGWMEPRKYANDENIERIEKKADEIRKECDAFVLVGVGGSNNAARAVIEAMDGGNGPEIIYSGNSTSPAAITRVLKRLDGKKSIHVNVIAKNFETLEPGVSFRVLRQYLYRRYGNEAAGRISATGSKGSSLEKLCRENGWDFFLFPDDVGGRFSMYSDVALLPLAVAGIDIRNYIRGAEAARADMLVDESMALRYAARRFELYRKGCKAEILSCFDPRMKYFFMWWVQLFGESEGKNSGGVLPVSCMFSEDLHSMGQFLQDGDQALFETFLVTEEDEADVEIVKDGIDDGFAYLDGKHFADLNAAACEAAYLAHSTHITCNKVITGKINEYTFGYLFMFFALVCSFTCLMEEINPFDQPGVEDYKKNMFRILGR